MSAYVIAVRLNTNDQEKLELYRELASQAAVSDMNVLTASGAQEILEGPPHEGIVIIEFPDIGAAKRWYFSDAYQLARKHRLDGADYQLTIVEGRAVTKFD